MCGIFAYRGSQNASAIVFNGLKNLQYRGYDSWGIAMLTKSSVEIKKNIGALPKKIQDLPKSSLAIGHTRWATHGGVTKENSHPHTSCDSRFVVVHNGIIENYSLIKSKLSKNHKYKSATDTEVIAHFIEEKSRSVGFRKAVEMLVNRISGHSAFVIIDTLTKDILAYRSGSPLVLGKNGEELFVSSDLPTLAPIVSYIYPMQDNELIDLCSQVDEIEWIKSPNVSIQKTLSTTKYHMESEMYETKEILANILKSKMDSYKKLEKFFTKSRDIILTGCGSSYHACLFGQYLFSQAGIVSRAVVASEGESVIKTVSKNSTIVVLSQSGETIDSIDFVTAAKKQGAHIIALTNVKFSSLDRLADSKLDLGVGVEVAVASTKAFVFMQLFFLNLVTYLSKESNMNQLKKYHNLLNSLYSPSGVKQVKKIAKELVGVKNLFVITKGDLISLGYEAALKYKEIGYMHAENVVSGELKHGPLALISENSVSLVVKRNNSRELDHTISEIAARGGKVIVLDIPDLGKVTSLYGVNLIHLISFYHSVLMGNNPDRPRNLAKSVTVK